MSDKQHPLESSLESLIIFRHSPYNSNLAKEGLDLVLAGAAFETRQALVFIDDAIYCALAQHDAASIGQKDLSKMLQVLPLYEVEELYYCSASAKQRGIDSSELNPQFKPLSNAQISTLIARSQQVLTF